jgi:hypothetical protein
MLSMGGIVVGRIMTTASAQFSVGGANGGRAGWVIALIIEGIMSALCLIMAVPGSRRKPISSRAQRARRALPYLAGLMAVIVAQIIIR